MKVYVVTSGTYSDYHIDAVFTNQEAAKLFANLNSDRVIETYDADSVEILTAYKVYVNYSVDDNVITWLQTGGIAREKVEYCFGQFQTWMTISKEIFDDIYKNGEKSKMLLKIVQDKWAQYKYEHQNEIDEEPKTIVLPPEEAVKAFAVKAAMINAGFAAKVMEEPQ